MEKTVKINVYSASILVDPSLEARQNIIVIRVIALDPFAFVAWANRSTDELSRKKPCPQNYIFIDLRCCICEVPHDRSNDGHA